MVKKSFPHEAIVGVILYAFLGGAYWVTTGMLAASALFPQMILAALAILNTVMVISAFVKKHKNKFAAKDTLMPLLYFAGIVVYAFLFQWLGYFPATAVMLVVYMAVMKVRPWWKIAVITAGYMAFIYLLFVVWLQTNLI